MRITPTNAGLGARVEGIDLARPLADGAFRTILRALGEHGVLCLPGQDLTPAQLSAFGSRFGELEVNVANLFHAPGHPEVMILSNMKDEEGRPLGLHDAGQGWHTDMSYSRETALANVVHARRVPMRDRRPLGDTRFRNVHAAYDDLPAEVKERLIQLGNAPTPGYTPERTRDFIAAEIARWTPVIRASGETVD